MNLVTSRGGSSRERARGRVKTNAGICRNADPGDRMSSHPHPSEVEGTQDSTVSGVDNDAAIRLVIEELGSDVRIAVDDLGSGPSNMRRVPLLASVHAELDISWIQDLEHDLSRQAFAADMQGLTSFECCDLLAEGFETEITRVAVRALSVRYAQGYLHGRPAPHGTFVLTF